MDIFPSYYRITYNFISHKENLNATSIKRIKCRKEKYNVKCSVLKMYMSQVIFLDSNGSIKPRANINLLNYKKKTTNERTV